MISRLRRKFIIISMLSVTAVLAVLIGSINIFNFRNVTREADNIIDMLVEGGGVFPEMLPPWPDAPFTDPFGGRRDMISPELRFEARYFTIRISYDGSRIATNTGMIAAVDASEAWELAEKVFEQGKLEGFEGDYRFRIADLGDSMLIVFYDCGRSLNNARSFLWISIFISLIGLLIVFALIAISSKAVVKPAAEAYEKQKRFITDAGHELKTPLAVINADCDVLEMENAGNEWIADIRKQTERLTGLTGRLIYLAKTEEGSKQKMTMIDFPLSDCISEEVESFKGLARASGKTITSEIADGLSYNGDQRAIEELVSILMDNAVKYSPEGGNIEVSLHKQGSKIIFRVYNDTKEPVPADVIKHMFDRFYRADSSRNSETGGYGIGLSIAKGITGSHGGKINAASKDKGIIITVEL
ncbi:MAG: HAMP domain-containing histidine kinase [Clostridiales bacterium]|nr:HAMP domain-containing histidine kinase [Clostridiales bacterium]